MSDDVRCNQCGWEGTADELVCSDEDANSSKPPKECEFNLCPRCGSPEIEDTDYDEEDEE